MNIVKKMCELLLKEGGPTILSRIDELSKVPWFDVKLSKQEILELETLSDWCYKTQNYGKIKTKLLNKTFNNHPRYKFVLHENIEDNNLDTRFKIAKTYGTWVDGLNYVFVNSDKYGKLFLQYANGECEIEGRVFFTEEDAKKERDRLLNNYKHLQNISPWLNEMVELINKREN